MPSMLTVAARVLVLAGFLQSVCSFVTHSPLPRFCRDRLASFGAQSLKCDATSPVIEATACRVLRLVLQNGREAHVSCSVQSDTADLLRGKLRGASVQGRNWASRLGLTARTIDVDVGNVSLDIGALFRRGALQFRTPPPTGNAIVVFNSADFGNFIAHRLVGRAVLAGRSFVFDREGVTIDPSSGVVAFGGTWGGERLRVALSQTSAHEPLVARVADRVRGEGRGSVGTDVDAIAVAMSGYFNNLEVDLDGPKLRFSSMSFEGSGVRGGRVKLRLGIMVRKLPGIRTVGSF